MSERADGVAQKVAARRARFREAVASISARARSTELLRMLLLPGAFCVFVGFIFMFFGWYGAARTAREIEQIPYLISGGFIGLALVFVGGLLLASAFWMSMLQRFSEAADERAAKHEQELEDRLVEQLRDRPATSRPPSRRPNGRARR